MKETKPMSKTKQTAPEAFQQQQDAAGRTRLDRPFTAEEARQQDAEHVERFLRERARRFFGPQPEEAV
jgi:hypothetical protein